jgi:hypothetical protein
MMFLTKNKQLPKNVWHKQECDYNGHEYKEGLLYLVVLVKNTMIFTPCIALKSQALWDSSSPSTLPLKALVNPCPSSFTLHL